MRFGRLDLGHLGSSGGGAVQNPPNTILAGRGAFTLNGVAMTPAAQFQLTVDAGAFSLTGNAATLIFVGHPKIIGDTGAFVLTGAAAILTYTQAGERQFMMSGATYINMTSSSRQWHVGEQYAVEQ